MRANLFGKEGTPLSINQLYATKVLPVLESLKHSLQKSHIGAIESLHRNINQACTTIIKDLASIQNKIYYLQTKIQFQSFSDLSKDDIDYLVNTYIMLYKLTYTLATFQSHHQALCDYNSVINTAESNEDMQKYSELLGQVEIVLTLRPVLDSLLKRFRSPIERILRNAAYTANERLVEKLILANVNLNSSDNKTKRTALHWALRSPQTHVQLKILKHLCHYGADINTKDIEGLTPLHYVCQQPGTTALAVILSYYPDAKLPDNNGITPLQLLRTKLEEAKDGDDNQALISIREPQIQLLEEYQKTQDIFDSAHKVRSRICKTFNNNVLYRVGICFREKLLKQRMAEPDQMFHAAAEEFGIAFFHLLYSKKVVTYPSALEFLGSALMQSGTVNRDFDPEEMAAVNGLHYIQRFFQGEKYDQAVIQCETLIAAIGENIDGNLFSNKIGRNARNFHEELQAFMQLPKNEGLKKLNVLRKELLTACMSVSDYSTYKLQKLTKSKWIRVKQDGEYVVVRSTLNIGKKDTLTAVMADVYNRNPNEISVVNKKDSAPDDKYFTVTLELKASEIKQFIRAWEKHDPDSLAHRAATPFENEMACNLRGIGFHQVLQNNRKIPALNFCLRSLDLAPHSVKTLKFLYKLSQELGDYRQAVNYINTAISVVGPNAQLYRILGVLYHEWVNAIYVDSFEGKRFDPKLQSALEYYANSLNIFPMPAVHYERAQLYFMLGDQSAADKDLAAAQELHQSYKFSPSAKLDQSEAQKIKQYLQIPANERNAAIFTKNNSDTTDRFGAKLK